MCPTQVELGTDSLSLGGFEGVDLLIVMQNTASMVEERSIIAGSIRSLVAALVDPPVLLPYVGVDELRIAMITSDMGLSAEGVAMDDLAPPELAGACQGFGDEGAFRSSGPAEILLDGGVVACPTADATWFEHSEESPDPEIALRAACLADQGLDGCPLGQPLGSAIAAFGREEQTAFFDPLHLLGVLIVSDRDDCTIAAGGALLGVDEMSDPSMNDVACGLHPELLAATDLLRGRMIPPRGSDIFAFVAIAGVPYGEEDGAAECRERGDMLDDCLNQDAMQLETVEDPDGVSGFRPACERYAEIDGGVRLVASAAPARRLVEAAAGFHSMGAVRSLCEPDWTLAMEQLLRLTQPTCGTCFDKPLFWDEARRVSTCDVVAAFVNPEGGTCPWPLAGGDEPETGTTATNGGEITTVYCPLPKLPMSLDCDDEARPTGFGWYYCENTRHEDNEIACNDDIDNDGDGQTDCNSPGCETCPICGGDGSACADRCPYEVAITDAAKPELFGAPVTVQCLKPSSTADPNCQEDSRNACIDGIDNDGDGAFDCAEVVGGGSAHMADPHCCPMGVADNGDCSLLDADSDGETDFQENCGVPHPVGAPACERAAQILGCALHGMATPLSSEANPVGG